jgi:hypothetical protein
MCFCEDCFSSLIEAPHHLLWYPLHRQMGRVPEGGWGVKPLAWCIKPPLRRLTSFGVTLSTIREKRLL